MRRFVTVVVAFAAAISASPSVGAAETTVPGNDYSWPQCAIGVGNGQGHPLPAGTHRFAVVGLTNGTGLHVNPCLESEWLYARSHAAFVAGYAVVTYPTLAQRAAARVGRYGRCATTLCRVRNNGWAQGVFIDRVLRTAAARPQTVWIDVEPRDKQPWSKSHAANAAVIKAMIASLHAHGYGVGIYSNRRMWRLIADYRTSLVEWVPADSLSTGCGLSFGGPVWLSQDMRTYTPTRAFDENGICRRAPRLPSWLQSSHPTVSTGRDATGAAWARYGTGRRFSLSAIVAAPPSVISVPTSSGTAPVFAAVTRAHAVRLRTLSSWWMRLPHTYCSGAAGLGYADGALSVECQAVDRTSTVTRVPLNAAGRPVGAPVAAAEIGAGPTMPASTAAYLG